ncbi:FAD binding domain-containing protein [Chitinophaga rhizophila]|uniref:FAD-dependent monooxygenase n=1 Tax=Chitinophaga rhizophila TaxID=2866212 RepID=A0ABS7GJJ9_9BACT|nr:FAD-dependent monooxygenase [Chitinophaga rhizophila]MBW8687894.1 FAD-dependent monooxygenase [Chitinophaga rhizophila]
MKIIVIGGSIGGLITGIAMLQQGFDVNIYERAAADMKDRGAGLVIQPEMIDYLIEYGIVPSEVFGVPARQRQILDEQGRPILKYQNDTVFTSWNYLWRHLKDYFPKERYFFGYEVEHISQNAHAVSATFKNGSSVTGDLLIGADGYNSTVRKTFLPHVTPQYAGYVAYRGLIPEKDMTAAEGNFFSDKFSLYPYEQSHILSYMVPGPGGELSKGNRLFNWVWYLNKSAALLNKLLTDNNGNKRRYSVPAGMLNNDAKTALRELADKHLPAILKDRIYQTREPFLQVIFDLAVPKMYEGRIAILGDAAFVVRPHTASGTAKAYRDAVVLSHSLADHDDLGMALGYWNEQQTRYAMAIMNHGKQLALRSNLGIS